LQCFSEQCALAEKHSQYFFKQPLRLHLHPLRLILAKAAEDDPPAAAVLPSMEVKRRRVLDDNGLMWL